MLNSSDCTLLVNSVPHTIKGNSGTDCGIHLLSCQTGVDVCVRVAARARCDIKAKLNLVTGKPGNFGHVFEPEPRARRQHITGARHFDLPQHSAAPCRVNVSLHLSRISWCPGQLKLSPEMSFLFLKEQIKDIIIMASTWVFAS
jgi:hypothetical protein